MIHTFYLPVFLKLLKLLIFFVNFNLLYTEPCDFYYHEKIEDLRRSPECNTRQKTTSCDMTLDTGWYKLLGKNGETQLPTFCPKRSSCGTDSPIWLNGNTCFLLCPISF